MKTPNYFFLIIFLIANQIIFAQTDESKKRESAINVFIDCDVCDVPYIKENLQLVNYVRDTKDSDVHILVTREQAGNGGANYHWFFMGQGKYECYSDTLVTEVSPDDTHDRRRAKRLKTMQIGLIPFISKTPMIRDIDFDFKKEENSQNKVVEDKWKSWVFNTDLNFFFNGQETQKSLDTWFSVEAQKVTPDLKIEFEGDYSYAYSYYSWYEEDVLMEESVIRNHASFDHLFVKSINDHWSWGYDFNIHSSTFANIDVRGSIYPSIEYNVFPYSESSRKQLRLLYGIGYNYSDYMDTTLYEKLSEGHMHQRLTVAFEIKEKWGSVSTSLRASNYLHDFDFNNLRLYTRINFRIFKGLSVNLRGSVAMIHDQLNIRKSDVSSEDIFLHKTELATQYNYWGSFGITYTFGSIYNNVVNPRFGN